MPVSSQKGAPAPPPTATPLSMRVQVYGHELLAHKETAPLASFRLRSSSSDTFADLAAAVIDRYERTRPAQPAQPAPEGPAPKPEVGAVLDDKDCAFDMEDLIDIVQPGEFIRFVLAAPVSPSIGAVETPRAAIQPLVAPSVTETKNSSIRTPEKVTSTPTPNPRKQTPTAAPANTSNDPVEVDARGTPVAPSQVSIPFVQTRPSSSTPVIAYF